MRFFNIVLLAIPTLYAADQDPDPDAVRRRNIEKLVQVGKRKTFGPNATNPMPQIDARAYKILNEFQNKNPEQFQQFIAALEAQSEVKPEQATNLSSQEDNN